MFLGAVMAVLFRQVVVDFYFNHGQRTGVRGSRAFSRLGHTSAVHALASGAGEIKSISTTLTEASLACATPLSFI